MHFIIALEKQKGITKSQFERLFYRYYTRMAAYATVIVNDNSIGDDIVQEVFANIWEKREDLNLGGGFKAYLFRSVYNRSINYIKTNNRYEKHEQQSLLHLSEEYSTYLHNDAHPLKELFNKEFETSLEALLEKLPLHRRKVFELVYRGGFKAKEVAKRLRMPERTVESHIYLTMKFLRSKLKPSDYFLLPLLYHFF